MGIRKIFQRSPFNKKKYADIFLEEGGLLKAKFSDGSYGYIVTFWVKGRFIFTREKTDALKILNSNKTIDHKLILKIKR